MKKILIAAAVVGAFSGVAQAQSTVTLYGVADVGVRIDRTRSGTMNSLTSGELAGSRWGMRGTEDLGGGLKANFMLEAGFAVDTGNSVANAADKAPLQLFSRTAYAGLSGAFGDIRMGNDYSPHFTTWSGIDPFGAASLATVGGKGVSALPTSVILATNATTGYVGGSTRMTNTIFYDTPTINGLSGRAAYKFGEAVLGTAVNTAASQGSAYSLSGTYANGPVKLSIANYVLTQAIATTQVYAINSKKTDVVFGGTYDFGVAKVAAQVFSEKGTLVSLASYSTRTTEIGLTVPVGAWTFKGQYSRYNDRVSAANLDATSVGLGADYALSKRSTLYARYSKVSNTTGATMSISGGLQGGANIVAGSSPSAISAGINVKF